MCGFPGFFVWMNQQKLGSKGKCSAGTEYGNFLQNKRKFEWIGQFIGQSKMPGNVDFADVWGNVCFWSKIYYDYLGRLLFLSTYSETASRGIFHILPILNA